MQVIQQELREILVDVLGLNSRLAHCYQSLFPDRGIDEKLQCQVHSMIGALHEELQLTNNEVPARVLDYQAPILVSDSMNGAVLVP